MLQRKAHQSTHRLTIAVLATSSAASVGFIPTPTDAAEPKPTSGAATVRCVQGWRSPGRDDRARTDGLDMLRRKPGEKFVVTEIRYFLGPEDAQIISPQRPVERWYIKAYAQNDPKYRHRWLLRRVNVGSGIDAIAAYDSRGYDPGIWKKVGDEDAGADAFEDSCFKAAVGQSCEGLPRAVLGCLDGT